jgi:hypothetical protein
VATQHLDLLQPLGGFGQHHPPVSDTAQVLAGEKAEAAKVTHGADFAPLVFGPGGLGAVFDHSQVMLASDLQDLVHGSRVAKQMDHNQRFGGRGDAAAQVLGVHGVGDRVDVTKGGFGPGQSDGTGGRDEGEGGTEHLVVRAQSEGANGQVQSVGSVSHPCRAVYPVPLSKLLLEGGDLRTQDIVGTAQSADHRLFEFDADGFVLAVEL